MEHCVLDNAAIPKVLHDDALEERRSDAGVPYPLGIDDDDRTACADAKARRFTSLDASWPEQEAFSLKQSRELGIQHAPLSIRRTEPPDTHEHVSRIGLHERGHALGREGHDEN